jgi:hypothetical protein
VADFEYALTDNLLALETELRDGHYRPGNFNNNIGFRVVVAPVSRVNPDRRQI